MSVGLGLGAADLRRSGTFGDGLHSPGSQAPPMMRTSTLLSPERNAMSPTAGRTGGASPQHFPIPTSPASFDSPSGSASGTRVASTTSFLPSTAPASKRWSQENRHASSESPRRSPSERIPPAGSTKRVTPEKLAGHASQASTTVEGTSSKEDSPPQRSISLAGPTERERSISPKAGGRDSPYMRAIEHQQRTASEAAEDAEIAALVREIDAPSPVFTPSHRQTPARFSYMPGQSLAAESSTPIQDTPSEAKSNRQPLYLAGGSSTAPVTITPEKLSKHVHLRVQIRTPSPVPPGSSSTIESPVAHPVHASPSGSPIVLNTPTGGAAVQASGAASPSMSAAPSAAPFSLANTGPVEKAPSPAAASTSTIATATVPATAIATAIISPQPLLKQRVSFAVVDESPRKAKPANEAWSPTAAEQKSSKQPAETKQQAIEMEIKAVTIREVESTDDTALSSSTDSLDSPSTRSCFCFRLKRIPPRVLQFPSQRGGGDATRQQKDKKGQAYAAPEDIASDSLNSSSTENHPYSFVYESNACWQGVIRVWHALVGFYCAVQLPLLALLHIVDTGLDVAVALWWGGFVGDSGENSALAGRADSMRWAIAAAVCISLPILISVILDALKPAQRPPSSSSAANSQIQPPNKWLLVLMNMLQLRGCYEVILIRRMNAAAAASDALTNPTATPAQQRELQQERDTQESQETHSQQITRCIFQCAPMMLLQLGVLASMYDSTSSPYDGAGGPPNLPWSSILLLSFFSSFLCLLTTIHRLLGSSPAFRKRAGKTGLVWFAGGMIAMHVAPTALGFILLLHILPWWVTLAAAGGSNLITGLLMLRAELCSPTRSRNENASHVIGILRLLFVLAPVETLTAAISASDLVSAANSAASGGRGGSSKRGWGHFRNEYWPLLVWQSLACIGCTVAYGCLGSLWTVELVGLMAGCIVGRILAVTFLVPKVDY